MLESEECRGDEVRQGNWFGGVLLETRRRPELSPSREPSRAPGPSRWDGRRSLMPFSMPGERPCKIPGGRSLRTMASSSIGTSLDRPRIAHGAAAAHRSSIPCAFTYSSTHLPSGLRRTLGQKRGAEHATQDHQHAAITNNDMVTVDIGLTQDTRRGRRIPTVEHARVAIDHLGASTLRTPSRNCNRGIRAIHTDDTRSHCRTPPPAANAAKRANREGYEFRSSPRQIWPVV